MQPDTSAVPIDPCKHCGSGAPVDVHFCPRCDRILTLGRHGDYFTFFGLRRRLRLDVKDLEQRFRALSRLFHPDYFHNATPTERLASLERSSYLNDAFRTLRDPMARLEYLLKLEGFTPKESRDSTTKVPQGLLEEVFELNEELEAIQDMRAEGASASAVALKLSAARRPIEANLARHEEQLHALMSEHDACLEGGDTEGRQSALSQLRTLLLERTYLMNLLSTVRRETGAAEAAAS
ncbi:MAG: Fe-S protein assembly co-chaperone HscB [Vicinamibacterales bacterium]